MRVLSVELQTVQRRYSPQFCVTFENEVTEEAQIETALWSLAEQLAEGRQVVFVADYAE